MSRGFTKPGVYWDENIQETMTITIAELIGDPERRAPFWGPIKQGPICQSLPEFLQKFVQHGYQLNEFTIIQALLINPIRFQDDDREAIISWLIFDILPRLQESHARIQTLETTVNMLWRRLSGFIKDLAEALPLEHRHGDDANAAKLRLNFLSIVLQHCKDNLDRDRASDAPRSTSGTGGASGCLGIDRRYKALTDRIQALEKMVQENRDNMESHQPFVMVEESAKTAHGQIVESEVQEPPLQFEALSDAPTSSTCTLSPASTVVNEPVGGSSNTGCDRVTTATTLDLRVLIHVDEIVAVSSDSIDYDETPYNLVVRMHRNAPFKSLTDKLCENSGCHELRQKNSPLKCIFDSDTPASLNLKQDDELIFAITSDRLKTLDLTI
ncbi:hypothetical protein KCU99_g7909, partial [Aureobasidium melanogenum]